MRRESAVGRVLLIQVFLTAEGAEKQKKHMSCLATRDGLMFNRSERVDQLADLMTIALRFLGRIFRKLLVLTQLLFGLIGLAQLPVSLGQAVMRFLQFWIKLDGLAVIRYCIGVLALLRMNDPELKMGGGKLGIQMESLD